ncbi:MAG TPA: redox-regulated ATPase YchF [Bacteroidales bacterium]|nr:redox-regulated ATPase YchF [Bacteroidales bacterium]HPT02805.1 redox-regulated ATPase YchF [Bacteroidales bacterium]
MGLKCGIIGLSNTGKTTLFNCVANTKVQNQPGIQKANIGQIDVPDERLFEIDKLIHSARIVHATVDLVDIPGLSKGSGQADSGASRFLADIQQTDALIHVIRCFDSDTVPHIEGSVNPVRDKEIVDLELCIRDLNLIERKIQRTDKLLKVGDKEARKIMEVLQVYKKHLEDFKPARTAPVQDEDRRYISELSLITDKPVIYVCNVDDGSAVNGNSYVEEFRNSLRDENAEVLWLAAELEAEIAELDNSDDRKAFLEDAGLSQPGVNKVVQAAYRLLNLQSFFTAGPKEVRAWTIHKGMTAPQAAGVIHSDLERGFIRAEVMKYSDFILYKSEHACRDAGKLSIEGKNYVIGDGDILNIRFNV